MGTHYNGGETSSYHTRGNDKKVIHTRSGTKIILNDAEGSVFIEDPSGNTYLMDGAGNINVNAVKHGIKGKENGGTIKIELFEKNHFIYITVDDTGRGRKQAISSDSGIGTSTYQKLFATLNNKNKDNATFEITDKEQGTKVEVRIPKDYQYS